MCLPPQGARVCHAYIAVCNSHDYQRPSTLPGAPSPPPPPPFTRPPLRPFFNVSQCAGGGHSELGEATIGAPTDARSLSLGEASRNIYGRIFFESGNVMLRAAPVLSD